jgi:hypothetical protein
VIAIVLETRITNKVSQNHIPELEYCSRVNEVTKSIILNIKRNPIASFVLKLNLRLTKKIENIQTTMFKAAITINQILDVGNGITQCLGKHKAHIRG